MSETMETQGYCDEKFAQVRDVLAESLGTDADIGASVAVTIDGEMVIDLWGGHLDEERSEPWQENTIVNVYSSTKTMSFLCALLLADREQLDFDANVADYWPEFAQNGKEQVKVWHIMDHAAGLSGVDDPLTTKDLYDWDLVTSTLAKQAPWWEPGTATAYHAITQGYLIGEVVRRISGKTLGQYFRDEISLPLEADFHIGVPESEFPRIGNLLPPDDNTALAGQGDKDSIAARTFRHPAVNALDSRTREWREAEIPAANGHGNARSIAKIHAILACKGEAQGTRLLSRETAESVMVERISGTDMALQMPVRFGLGFGINAHEKILAPNENVCYWGGWGGSLALIDQDAQMSFSYVMNRMEVGLTGDLRSYNLGQAIYSSL
ncbi:MAG: serine hydrolase domain-containing protein [bacterium]|nr:class A beta-lactamase-related serine hydrolase [Gammaproteobacteria bacterium]HIL94459.1 class A beta-lactamase-related serine hydrolase [Pseudomonadales bacterium]